MRLLGGLTPVVSSYDIRTEVYLGALRQTGAALPTWFGDAVNTFVLSLVGAGLWPKLASLSIARNSTEPCVRVNLVSPGFNNWTAPYGAVPAFTQWQGAKGSINAGYRSAVAMASSPGLSQNNQGIFGWVGVAGTIAANAFLSIVSGSSSQRTARSNPANSTLHVEGRVGSSTATTTVATVANRTGFRAVMRGNASNQRLYGPDGTLIQSAAVASTGISPQGLTVFLDGVQTTFSDDVGYYWGFGQNLTDNDVMNLYAALSTLDAAINSGG